jgi:hypothetical protein
MDTVTVDSTIKYTIKGILTYFQDSKQDYNRVYDQFQKIDRGGGNLVLLNLLYTTVFPSLNSEVCIDRIKLDFNIKDERTTSSWYKFLEKMNTKIKKCERYYIVLLNINIVNTPIAHRNILFIEKLKDRLNILRYEPAGYYINVWEEKGKDSVDSFIKEFGEGLEEISEKKVNVFKREATCPIGLQTYSKDRKGYCVMFSYFWAYCVMNIISVLEKNYKTAPSLDTWIDKVERYIARQSLFPENLFNIIVTFASYTNKIYWEERERMDKRMSILTLIYKDLILYYKDDEIRKMDIKHRIQVLKGIKQDIIDKSSLSEVLTVKDVLFTPVDSIKYVSENIEKETESLVGGLIKFKLRQAMEKCFNQKVSMYVDKEELIEMYEFYNKDNSCESESDVNYKKYEKMNLIELFEYGVRNNLEDILEDSLNVKTLNLLWDVYNKKSKNEIPLL